MWQTWFYTYCFAAQIDISKWFKTSSLVIKECFRCVRYDAKFKKLCEDCDVLINNGCLRFDILFKV